MLKMQVIGCGAAGNKAVIDAYSYLGDQYMSYLLINSTDKDIPPEYRDSSMIFGHALGGCGKEREMGKRMFLQDIKNGVRALDDRVDPNADFVVVCGSTEGGSGSATIPIITKYIKQVLHIPTIAVLFFGFNDDARGMQNSIEVCQELEDDIGVIAICNSKFMDMVDGNKLKAEIAANLQFNYILEILCGKNIHPSSQNIDDTDLKKVVTTPGYMTVEYIDFNKIKNITQFNKAIDEALDEHSTTMMSPSKSAKRIAVVFDVKNNADYVDYSCNEIKKYYGTPYELFTHVQNFLGSDRIDIIVSGQKLPINEVMEIYEEYKLASSAIDKDRDNFFAEMGALRGNPEDAMFNMNLNDKNKPTEEDKNSFFRSFGMDSNPTQHPTKSNVKNVSKDY